MKRITSLIALALFICLLIPSPATAASHILSPDDTLQDILAFYEAENMYYIDEMPACLLQEYSDTIEMADIYLVEFYGKEIMISTSDDFVLDQYCTNIKLGLLLDLSDQAVKTDIMEFTTAAAKIYIKQNNINRGTEQITEDSSAPYIQPRLSASNYNATAAVAYAHLWTEEGDELQNPDYHRYDSDCTNFVSQVLYAGGIPQVSGNRTSSAAWFYDWGLIARPSYTWSGAHNLYEHLRDYSSNVVRITSTVDLKVGDIISFDTEPDDGTFHIGHTAVVTAKTGNSWDQIFLTYHSRDREDYAASNLINLGYLAYAWSVG